MLNHEFTVLMACELHIGADFCPGLSGVGAKGAAALPQCGFSGRCYPFRHLCHHGIYAAESALCADPPGHFHLRLRAGASAGFPGPLCGQLDALAQGGPGKNGAAPGCGRQHCPGIDLRLSGHCPPDLRYPMAAGHQHDHHVHPVFQHLRLCDTGAVYTDLFRDAGAAGF